MGVWGEIGVSSHTVTICQVPGFRLNNPTAILPGFLLLAPFFRLGKPRSTEVSLVSKTTSSQDGFALRSVRNNLTIPSTFLSKDLATPDIP